MPESKSRARKNTRRAAPKKKPTPLTTEQVEQYRRAKNIPGDLSNMVNPNLNGSTNFADYKFTKGFPTRENCDLDNPREKFLWCLVALPGMRGASLAMPVDYLMMISEHLHECGVDFVRAPTKKWQPPKANDPHWMTSPGRWVSADTPDEAGDPAQQALDALTRQQKAEIFERLKRMQESGDF